VRRRQGRAERRRESDDETEDGSDAAVRHDRSVVADFLTKVWRIGAGESMVALT
jgi:hypothetical protein